MGSPVGSASLVFLAVGSSLTLPTTASNPISSPSTSKITLPNTLPVVVPTPVLPAAPSYKGTIALDAGHGGLTPIYSRNKAHSVLGYIADTGAIGSYRGHKFTEATAVALLAQDVRDRLVAMGYRVLMTRDGPYANVDRDRDGASPMGDYRGKLADGAIGWVSFHCDSFKAGSRHGHGPQVYFGNDSRPIDRMAARKIADLIDGEAREHDGGLAVLHPANQRTKVSPMTGINLPQGAEIERWAVLIEELNIKDSSQTSRIMDAEKRHRMADIDADAIAAAAQDSDLKIAAGETPKAKLQFANGPAVPVPRPIGQLASIVNAPR